MNDSIIPRYCVSHGARHFYILDGHSGETPIRVKKYLSNISTRNEKTYIDLLDKCRIMNLEYSDDCLYLKFINDWITL